MATFCHTYAPHFARPHRVMLTARQQQILEYLALGCTNQEIARFLDLSLNTVKTHVAALYKTLDANNRTEAVHRYRALELRAPAAPPGKSQYTIVALPPLLTNNNVLLLDTASAIDELMGQRLSQLHRFTIGVKATSESHYDLEGSLRQERDHLRLSIRLLAPPHGRVHWAHSFPIPLHPQYSDLEDLCTVLGIAVHAELLKAEAHRIGASSAANRTPWELSLRGMYFLEHYRRSRWEESIAYFAQALTLDPHQVLAHHGMAMGYALALLEQWKDDTNLVRANVQVHAAACALLQPDSPDTLLAQAVAQLIEGKLEAAEVLLRETLRSNPCSTMACNLLGHLHVLQGNAQEAQQRHQQFSHWMCHLPARFQSHGLQAMYHLASREYSQAIATCRTGLAYGTESVFLRLILMVACKISGDEKSACEEYQALLVSRPDFCKDIFCAQMPCWQKSPVRHLFHETLASIPDPRHG